MDDVLGNSGTISILGTRVRVEKREISYVKDSHVEVGQDSKEHDDDQRRILTLLSSLDSKAKVICKEVSIDLGDIRGSQEIVFMPSISVSNPYGQVMDLGKPFTIQMLDL